MPIVTRAEAKTFLQIASADTSKDALIDALIPCVQNFIVSYCNNKFKVENHFIENNAIYRATNILQNSNISFEASTRKIKCDSEEFVIAGFMDGFDICVEGSRNNDNIYTIATVAPGELTLAAGTTLYDEASLLWIRITRVFFPMMLKLTASKMISFDMNKHIASGLSSFGLADYTAAYVGDYPKSILTELSPFRKVQW